MDTDHLTEVCNGYTGGMATLTRLFGEHVVQGSVHASFTGLPIPPFNSIHAWTDHPELEADITALVAHGERLRVPMAICVAVGAPHEARVVHTASDLGFAEAGEPAAAMTLADAIDVPALPAELTCGSPTDAADLAVVAQLVSASFGLPEEMAREVAVPETLEWDDTEWFTLTRGSQPVGTSMLFELGTTANVFNVGVPAEHRRHGYGAAATWEVVRRGRERGATLTALLASEMGEPVYERMGFDTVGRLRTLMRV